VKRKEKFRRKKTHSSRNQNTQNRKKKTSQPTTVPLSAFGSGEDDEENGFCLLQVPSRLPTLAAAGASFGGRRSPPVAAASAAAGKKAATKGKKRFTTAALASASDLHPGTLGKVLVLRSGRIVVRMGGVDFDLSPGLPVDALTTALLLQPPASAMSFSCEGPSSPSSPSSSAADAMNFFPTWPPPAIPDNPARGAIPLGRVTARATLVPSLDSALPEAALDLLAAKKKMKSSSSLTCSSSSDASSSDDSSDRDDSESTRERRNNKKGKRSSFPRRARGCKLPADLDREWARQQEAKAASRMEVDNEGIAAATAAVARTPERAAGKKTATAAAAGVGGASAGKRRVVDSDESD